MKTDFDHILIPKKYEGDKSAPNAGYDIALIRIPDSEQEKVIAYLNMTANELKFTRQAQFKL